jgi:hypothetical protein
MKRTTGLFFLFISLFLLSGPLGCGSEDHVNIFHASFVADDVPLNYSTKVGFLHVGTSDYSISYDEDRDHPVYGENHLMITLPLDVHTDAIYNQDTRHALIYYQDAEGRTYDSRLYDSTMEIHVTSWLGPGHYGYGTFTAQLVDEHGQVAILEHGWFEGFIHNR